MPHAFSLTPKPSREAPSALSLRISLAPDGSLQLELPGAFGSFRLIPLRETATVSAGQTIKRILSAQAQGEIDLGLDGAPTRAQVQHWERHQTFPDSRCAFCASAARSAKGMLEAMEAAPHRSSHLHDARYAERKLGGGVTIKKIPLGLTSAKVKGAQAAKGRKAQEPMKVSTRSSKELGF